MNLLLSDEKYISSSDSLIRNQLYEEFMNLPETFVSKMRHLQPQVGCFNNCSFCSKFSVCKSEYWSLESLRNVIAALKYTSLKYTKDDILLAWDRKEHRVGVIFPYLNNDISSYPFLDQYIDLCYRELGVRTRISTVGFSRHNKILNEMHKRICSNDLIYALGGVRLSICQYGRVWEEKSSKNSIYEYERDLANFLKIYKSYFDKFGSGSRKMCVELRYNPLVENSKVLVFSYNNKFIIATGTYLFVSRDNNVIFPETYIVDPYKHSLELSNDGFKFYEYNLDFIADNEDEIIEFIDNHESDKLVDIFMLKNKDGIYYSINPKITDEGNYGMNIYPKTDVRDKDGYVITERFFLNALYNFKKKRGLGLRESIQNTTYDDCNEVISLIEEYAKFYNDNGKIDKSEYIKQHVIPLLNVYINALKLAGYSSDSFFDKNFTIDTGMICNLGRAINLFKGITKFINEPLTPTHERNYGRHCSTMKQENSVWLLGCGFNDSILIEKLDLFNTASVEGQVSYKDNIVIPNFNKKINENEKYLYPGEVE